jgi:predicted O-methyltransferase YrrM
MTHDTPTFPNWFEGQKYLFERNLTKFKGQSNLRFLQIGAYTGDASVWLLENILTDPTSILLDVDTWEGSGESEHTNINFDKVYEYYKKRTEPYANLRSVRNNSDNFFQNNKTDWDFIYIDGDHTSEQVARDADGAWSLLKSQGIIAFDDYGWGKDMPEHLTPKPAIDAFLAKYAGEYDLLTQEYQVWVQKK